MVCFPSSVLIWIQAASLALALLPILVWADTLPDQDVSLRKGLLSLNTHDHVHDQSAGKSRVYSLFMHHSAGAAVLAIGGLLFADRVSRHRFPLIRIAISGVWILLGLFLFIRADPEGWPMGTSGLMESMTMPTAREWLQHKLLAVIPMLLGLHAAMGLSVRLHARWKYGLAIIAVVGAIGLLSHQHRDHPGMDVVTLQHRLFAVSVLLIAIGLALEEQNSFPLPLRRFMFPTGIMLLGLQLTLYVE